MRNRFVALIERPDAALAECQEPRPRPHRDCLFDQVRERVYPNEEVLLAARHPHGIVAEREAEGARRDGDLGHGLAGRRVDPRERPFRVGHQPHAARADGDAAFAVADGHGCGGHNLTGLQINAPQRRFAAHGYREAAGSAARPEQGALPTLIAPTALFARGLIRITVSSGSLEIHTSSSMAIQSGAPGTSKTWSGFKRSIGMRTDWSSTPGPSTRRLTLRPRCARTLTRRAVLSTGRKG